MCSDIHLNNIPDWQCDTDSLWHLRLFPWKPEQAEMVKNHCLISLIDLTNPEDMKLICQNCHDAWSSRVCCISLEFVQVY